MNSVRSNRVVLWGAEPGELDTLAGLLARRSMPVDVLYSLESVRLRIEKNDVDLVLARLCLRSRRSLELLSRLQDLPFAPPVLVVTEKPDVPLYLEAMQRGAFDCVALPLNENELIRIVSRALETRQLQVAV